MRRLRDWLDRIADKGANYEEIGKNLADALEHRPDIVEPIVNERVRAYSYLAAVARLLKRFKINTIIDAGAHSGQFAGPMYGFCGFRGAMHSFEPVNQFYQKLAGYTKHYPGWLAYNEALGDVPGKSTVWVGTGHGGTSSLLRGNKMLERLVPDCVLGEGQEVNVVRIDERLRETLDDPAARIMLKIDTQGFERRVLLGCGSRLSRMKLLHFEGASVPLYDGQETLTELLQFVGERGFIPIYFSNNFAGEPFVYVDFDVICVNREEIGYPG